MGHSVDITYRVEPEELHWVVSFGGLRCGHFDTRIDAVRSAMADAQRVSRLGHHVQVQVQRVDGSCRQLLSLSQDKVLRAQMSIAARSGRDRGPPGR